MGLSNPAGSFRFYHCPKCNKRIKIFHNSWFGNGVKICPECKVRIPCMVMSKKSETLVENKLKLHKNQKDE